MATPRIARRWRLKATPISVPTSAAQGCNSRIGSPVDEIKSDGFTGAFFFYLYLRFFVGGLASAPGGAGSDAASDFAASDLGAADLAASRRGASSGRSAGSSGAVGGKGSHTFH